MGSQSEPEECAQSSISRIPELLLHGLWARVSALPRERRHPQLLVTSAPIPLGSGGREAVGKGNTQKSGGSLDVGASGRAPDNPLHRQRGNDDYSGPNSSSDRLRGQGRWHRLCQSGNGEDLFRGGWGHAACHDKHEELSGADQHQVHSTRPTVGVIHGVCVQHQP